MIGCIGMDHVISELCYKETILQSNYRKVTIIWYFLIGNFFEKFQVENSQKSESHNMLMLYPNACDIEVVLYKNNFA